MIREIQRIEEGPFNFVLYSDGSIRVSSMGHFVNLEERPELLRKAKKLFEIERKIKSEADIIASETNMVGETPTQRKFGYVNESP